MNSKVDLKFTDGFGEEFSAESLSWLKNFFKEEYSYWTSTNIKTIQSSPRHRYLEGGDQLINIIDEIKEQTYLRYNIFDDEMEYVKGNQIYYLSIFL